MPKINVRALTPKGIDAARPIPGKTLRLTDGGGLRLLVAPNGRKTWEFRSQAGGREVTRQLGVYPDMTLAAARVASEAARVAARSAPSEPGATASMTFEDAFEDWFAVKAVGLKPGYTEDIRERLTFNAMPALGRRPLADIRRKDIVALLERIAARGAHVQARRVRGLLSELFEWAMVKELIADNPAPDAVLRALPKRPKKVGHAAARFEDMPTIMKTFGNYPSRVTGAALQFVVLTAARTSEVRCATWSEFDLDAKVWTVPAERMKAEREHRVPLSEPALRLLRAMRDLGLSKRLVFPTLRGDRPMSENAMLYAVKGMGFDITVHGFRSTFSTWANETRAAESDVIEAALAHTIPDVKGDYDRGDRFDARRSLMRKWAKAIRAA